MRPRGHSVGAEQRQAIAVELEFPLNQSMVSPHDPDDFVPMVMCRPNNRPYAGIHSWRVASTAQDADSHDFLSIFQNHDPASSELTIIIGKKSAVFLPFEPIFGRRILCGIALLVLPKMSIIFALAISKLCY